MPPTSTVTRNGDESAASFDTTRTKTGDENDSGKPSGAASNRHPSSPAAATPYATEASVAETSKRPGALCTITGSPSVAATSDATSARNVTIRRARITDDEERRTQAEDVDASIRTTAPHPPRHT